MVYVSTAQQGAVFAVVDRLDGSPRTACVLLANDSAPSTPNGVAYDPATSALYIAGVRFGALVLGGRGSVLCERACRPALRCRPVPTLPQTGMQHCVVPPHTLPSAALSHLAGPPR